MKQKNDRLTVVIDPYCFLRLTEMKNKLNVSYARLVRIILINFIENNEERINNILDK